MRILSYGGGRQTVAIICMSLHGDLPKPNHVIFADTQCESKTTYAYNEFVKSKLKGTGIKWHTVTIGNIIKDSLSGDRFASIPFFTESDNIGGGMLRRQCTNEYKIQPVYRKIREIVGLKPRQRYDDTVEMWIGYSAGEARRVANFKKSKHYKWIKPVFPLVDKGLYIDKCLGYLKEKGWGIPDKSACIMCPYKSDLMWRELKTTRPDEFQRAVEYERIINDDHAVAINNKVYLHRSRIPLDQVDFTSQHDLFDCKWGVCGI